MCCWFAYGLRRGCFKTHSFSHHPNENYFRRILWAVISALKPAHIRFPLIPKVMELYDGLNEVLTSDWFSTWLSGNRIGPSHQRTRRQSAKFMFELSIANFQSADCNQAPREGSGCSMPSVGSEISRDGRQLTGDYEWGKPVQRSIGAGFHWKGTWDWCWMGLSAEKGFCHSWGSSFKGL